MAEKLEKSSATARLVADAAPKSILPTEFKGPFADATRQFVEAVEKVAAEDIIGWAHDRMDPDTMGAVGLCWFILKDKFAKKFVCYHSKQMSFLMNRSLAKNFLPTKLILRCEEEKDLQGIATRAPLIMV